MALDKLQLEADLEELMVKHNMPAVSVLIDRECGGMSYQRQLRSDVVEDQDRAGVVLGHLLMGAIDSTLMTEPAHFAAALSLSMNSLSESNAFNDAQKELLRMAIDEAKGQIK